MATPASWAFPARSGGHGWAVGQRCPGGPPSYPGLGGWPTTVPPAAPAPLSQPSAGPGGPPDVRATEARIARRFLLSPRRSDRDEDVVPLPPGVRRGIGRLPPADPELGGGPE